MSRNIKEIGKELLGKSLNSFHRKTGLTQLEKNNEMQDGILDGILSQVDNAYIEKTEQSNVIHLDGSGDGVVVLDSVEGNTMVNRMPKFNGIYTTTSEVIVPSFEAKYSRFGNSHCLDVTNMPRNITIISLGKGIGVEWLSDNENGNGVSWKGVISTNQTIKHTILDNRCTSLSFKLPLSNGYTSNDVKNIQILILEGDWTNREIPQYFKGLQSSFEEKVNDEGKYEIEILSRNMNIICSDYKITKGYFNNGVPTDWMEYWRGIDYIPCSPTTTYYANYKYNGVSKNADLFFFDKNKNYISWKSSGGTSPTNAYYCIVGAFATTGTGVAVDLKGVTDIMVTTKNIGYIQPKQNKIKLLINEPLRAINSKKDNICIKDGRLMVEKKCIELVYNGTENWEKQGVNDSNCTSFYAPTTNKDIVTMQEILCNILPYKDNTTGGASGGKIFVYNSKNLNVIIEKNKLSSDTVEGFKNYLKTNNLKVVIPLKTPYYEEVLNEHGEPILLEGYENGTIYIDSTIVPTTTVRYTPKMESFNVLKEVNNNNIMLTNDIDDNIIPYMMDVDLMIMEKEMALMSHQYKIRTIGVKDMTSMQKRTQDMLTRLIKGKTLTEQECKTRVTTYLNAGKITDAQAEELNFLIDEIYA